MRATSMVAIVLLASACAPKAETPATTNALSASELDAVKAVDAAFSTAMNAKDTTGMFAAYADDAMMMPQDSPVLTGAAQRAVLVGLLTAGASDFSLSSTTAYGVGDLAYMVGTARFKMSGVADSLKYTEVLRRGADGKWRYVVDMFSNMVAPAPAMPAKK